MTIKGLHFLLTCSACPEQYDVEDQHGNSCGYIRLRHGELRCDYPYIGCETIYFDDEWMGSFDDNEQRMKYLRTIADKLLAKIKENQ